MSDLFEEGLDAVAAEREEVLKAFLAKHKCAPDDVEQVHRMSPEGMVWFLRLRRARGPSCEWRGLSPGCGTARRHSGPVPHRCPYCKQEVSVIGRVSL